MCRVPSPECAPRMAPRPLQCDPVPPRAECLCVLAVTVRPVACDHRIDPRATLSEAVFQPAQSTETFLTYGADEEEVGIGPEPNMLHRLESVEDGDQPSSIICDPGCKEGIAPLGDSDIGPFGEDGVEVPYDRDDPILTPSPSPPEGDDIFDLIDIDTIGPGLEEHLGVLLRPDLLLEGWRGDLSQHDQIAERIVIGRLDVLESSSDLRPLCEVFDLRAVGGLLRRTLDSEGGL